MQLESETQRGLAVKAAFSLENYLRIVSIGWHPKYFLERHRALYAPFVEHRTIYRITYYSPVGTPHFRRFAAMNSEAFEMFAHEFRPKYEHFIQNSEYCNRWKWCRRFF